MGRARAIALIAGALTLIAGCEEQSREEKISALRSYYRAEFNGFLVTQTPIEQDAADPVVVEEGEEVAVEFEGEAVEVELRTVLLLDLLVQHSSPERLPGVTVDVSMVDAQEREKARWRVWVETADLAKSTHKQVSHEVEVDNYEEGDGFWAEVRHPIPPAERSEYREFTAGVD